MKHGTWSMYVNRGCRCLACRAANRAAIALYRARGTTVPRATEPEPQVLVSLLGLKLRG